MQNYHSFKIEDALTEFENVLNNFSAVQQGKDLLAREKSKILLSIKKDIPTLVYCLSNSRLSKKLGFKEIDFSDLYFPVYTFQYVSAGGNSSLECNIKLDIDNLNKFVIYINELVKFKKA